MLLMCEENPQKFLSAELQKLKRLGWRVSNLPLKTTWLFHGTLVRTGIPFPIHSTTRATALKVNVDISIFVVRIWPWNATIIRNNSQYTSLRNSFSCPDFRRPSVISLIQRAWCCDKDKRASHDGFAVPFWREKVPDWVEAVIFLKG